MFGKRVALLFLVCAGMCFGQWVQAGSGEWYVSAFAVSGDNIFAGTNLGVFLSTNNGTSWDSAGLTNTSVTAFAVSGNNIFAGTASAGVFLSTNNGATWGNAGLTNTRVLALAVSGNNIFAGIATAPEATTGKGVILSTNNGASWTAVDSGLTALWVSALAISGNDIFAGADDNTPIGSGGVFLSTNNGASWVNTGLSNTSVLALAVSGNNIFAATGHGIFLSTNNGASWTAVNSGLPDSTAIFSLAVSGNNIFAGTNTLSDSGGVFLSTNNGASWVNTGLPKTNVLALAVSGNNIFAGTQGKGVWRRPLSEMLGVINPNPHQEMLKPYANGFKINISKNSIALLLPETLNNGAISVELVNIAGRKIYSATHQAYNGILSIPVSGLSTGTYLMLITGRNITMSSSFVVSK